jgi:hypothetical protein
MKKNYYSILIISLLCQIHSFADTNDTDEKEWNYEFSVYLWPYQERFIQGQEIEKAPPLYYIQNGEYIPLDLSIATKAPWYNYKSSDPLVFYIKKTNSDGEEFYKPYTFPKIPLDGRRIMIFIYPWDFVSKNIRLSIPIETDDKLFPPGHDKFANFTKDNMYLKVAENKVLLKSLESIYFDTTEYESKQLPLLLLKKNEYDEWQRAFATNVYAPKDTKMVYIFFESRQAKGRLRLYTINVN